MRIKTTTFPTWAFGVYGSKFIANISFGPYLVELRWF